VREPTAALDAETEHALFERLRRPAKAGRNTGRLTIPFHIDSRPSHGRPHCRDRTVLARRSRTMTQLKARAGATRSSQHSSAHTVNIGAQITVRVT